MSEIKLCPMKKDVILQKSIHDGSTVGHLEDFLPCIQEKCAWWIMGCIWSGEKQDVVSIHDVPGHCAALDWRNHERT